MSKQTEKTIQRYNALFDSMTLRRQRYEIEGLMRWLAGAQPPAEWPQDEPIFESPSDDEVDDDHNNID